MKQLVLHRKTPSSEASIETVHKLGSCLTLCNLTQNCTATIREQTRQLEVRVASRSPTMVSSSLVEALIDPTRVLRAIYDPSKEIDIFPSTVSSYFSQVFESVDAFQEVRVSHSALTPSRDLMSLT
jgi:hypothetical protein